MNKKDQFYLDASSFIDETVAVALINLIPGIGGSIGSVISNILAERKQQRINEFLQALKLNIEGLSERVNNEYINQNDFLDLFEGTSIKIMSQRSKTKRDALKNNFVSGIVATNVDYDKVETYEKIIDYLNEESLMILLALYDPEGFELPKVVVDPMYLPSKDYLFGLAFPDILSQKLEECEILLESQRLISGVTMSGYPPNTLAYDALKSLVTKRGEDFTSYVSDKFSK